jgi:FkbM family methyltransferase
VNSLLQRSANTIKAVNELARFFSNHPLTRDAQLKAWTRFASWQLRSRIHDEILFQWIGGQRLAVRRGMSGATGNIYVGLHEFTDMMLPLHFLREGDLFLDIGANVGSYTVLASGVCRAKTWAFEPDPNTLQYLKRNVTVNNLSALVRVSECALGAYHGEVPFTVGLDTVNRIAVTNDMNVQMVRQERLDTVIDSSQPIMIKVDVEGAEGRVLQGAAAVLASPCLKVIELETATSEVAVMLDSNRFERAYYNPFNRKLHREPIELRSSNFLFVRDWRFVAKRLATAESIKVLNRWI